MSIGARATLLAVVMTFACDPWDGSALNYTRALSAERLEPGGGTVVRSGSFVYVADLRASDGGDVAQQCERILRRASHLLESAGSSLATVASVTVYLRSQKDYAGMNATLRDAWPVVPPARTTVVVDGFREEGARVEMSLVGIVAGTERRVVTPPSWKPMPYSYGILSGGTLFLAGLVSRDPSAGANVPGDAKAQTRTALENGAAVLAAAGMTYRDVVAARLFIREAGLLHDVDSVYRAYFPGDPPPRVVVGAGFPSQQYLVEISLVATRTAQRPRRLYVGGVTGTAPGTRDNVAAQAEEAVARVGRRLRAAGFDWRHVVEQGLFLRDIGELPAVEEALGRLRPNSPPAPTVVQAPLMDPEARLEIVVTAAR